MEYFKIGFLISSIFFSLFTASIFSNFITKRIGRFRRLSILDYLKEEYQSKSEIIERVMILLWIALLICVIITLTFPFILISIIIYFIIKNRIEVKSQL